MGVVHVLIVDDSAIVRFRLAEMVESVEHVAVVGQVPGATQAILALHQLRPDLLIVDIQMPDGDGVAVLEAAKQLAPAPTVMMLTNYVDEYFRSRCRAAGAVSPASRNRRSSKRAVVFPLDAPSATRMPISCTRRVTEYAITP